LNYGPDTSVTLFQDHLAWDDVTVGAKYSVLRKAVIFSEENGSRTAWKEYQREPRGSWSQHQEEVASLCEELSLVHVVDPFRCLPARETETAYFRLHGIGGDETNYGYSYTNEDLERLLSMVSSLRWAEKAYVMFNNVSMAEDALRGKRLLGSSTEGRC